MRRATATTPSLSRHIRRLGKLMTLLSRILISIVYVHRTVTSYWTRHVVKMVLRDKVPRVVPTSCSGRMTCIFLVFVPMLTCLTLAGLWMYHSQQKWRVASSRETHIHHTILQIGRVIMDFNAERELTATYVTARTPESQLNIKSQLDEARQRADQSVAELFDWPGSPSEGQMYKSKLLFNAVLGRHRDLVKVNNYFMEEVQFYTDIIDVMYGWLHRFTDLRGDAGDLWVWLLSYTYLMGSINYLGAEQALCTVFHSIICLSHRETLYYANFSFGGEAVFRLYRQSYPGYRDAGWRRAGHSVFFPELNLCREEIYADLDYLALSLDPSFCDYSRKNETQFHETDLLAVSEHRRIVDALDELSGRQVVRATSEFLISGLALGAIFSYVILLHIIRCTCIKCIQTRASRKWRLKEMEAVAMTEEKMDGDHVGLNADHVILQAPPTTNIYRYEDYNCKPNTIKVATV